MTASPIWSPSSENILASKLTEFARPLGFSPPFYHRLHQWSIRNPGAFWSRVWEYAGIHGDQGGEVYRPAEHFIDDRWFCDGALNYAENLLAHDVDATAIIAVNELGERRAYTFGELRIKTAQCAAQLVEIGVEPGDCVAGWLPNVAETVIAMLATTSLGAMWTSCSPDFGVQGALDRFGQINPKVLFGCRGYVYNGRRFDTTAKIQEVVEAIPSIEATIWLNADDDGEITFDSIWQRRETEPNFPAFPFNQPLFVMYSSGTTGKPKCIVHGAGGTLLQHVKEHQLHCNLGIDVVLFFFTTTGWMMWNWLASALASGCTIVLYDGSPFYPNSRALISLIDNEAINVFGVGAKYLSGIQKANVAPRTTHRLDSLNAILSTGSPLIHESYDYVYKEFKPDVWLASISGGTDLISCFVLGNPWLPVYRGQIQAAGLGMDVEVFGDDARTLRDSKGELVCRRSFPSAPLGFWDDPGKGRYRAAYFDRFSNCWAHGDFAERDSQTKGFLIHGRSDAVLNPAGVRIGTAEIYRQVESVPEIKEAVCIGQEWHGDSRVVLFVVMNDGYTFSPELVRELRTRIRTNTSPRHVPAKILEVPEVPVTRSGKIAELAVRDAVHGRNVTNTSALANPDSLTHFRDVPALSI